MPREIFDNEQKLWLRPEEMIETLKKRKAEGNFTLADASALRELEASLTEREKEPRILRADPPEIQKLKEKAEVLREDEKRKHPGGHYL